MENEIAVSIICNAYNHEPYIRDALESFISQKTKFRFEVIVHDDASTDGTASIIREYEKKYPEIIKPIYETENQHSKKIGITREINMPKARGKYIAFCEGDDFWIDDSKLQRQYDILESQPSVVMCCHSTQRINADSKKNLGLLKASINNNGMIDYIDCLSERNFPHLSSMFFRKQAYLEEPEWFYHLPVGDYPLRSYFLSCGQIYYIHREMSCYRVMSQSSWSKRYRKNYDYQFEMNRKMNDFLRKYDEHTGFKYHEFIQNLIQDKSLRISVYSGHFKEAKELELYKKSGILIKAITNLGLLCPKLALSALQFRTTVRLKMGKA